ncbi:MAG: alpha/beta hydrolase [Acidimicrobiia bacterium]
MSDANKGTSEALEEEGIDEVITYPGARRPDRFRAIDSFGLRIAVYEWGDERGEPVFLVHGGFDFAGTFDVFAPLLADAGYRVISWDQRGHGDSEHAHLYSWDADIRDALRVIDSVSREPVSVIGHSKGGALMLHLAEACPHRVKKVVNIDGLPSRRPSPDIAERERRRMLGETLRDWLQHRARAAEAVRKPGTIDDLARRRGRMNPRLSLEWLRYLVPIGARKHPDGWRWKIDPSLRFGGLGPWKPEWALFRLRSMSAPLLGILGLQPEQMGWGTTPETVKPFLPEGARLEVFEDAGHFVHIEKPKEVAELVLEFLENG